MAARGAGEVEIDDAELDALIEEYKKMKDAGHLDDLDEDFSNHPFFMDHMPTVSEPNAGMCEGTASHPTHATACRRKSMKPIPT